MAPLAKRLAFAAVGCVVLLIGFAWFSRGATPTVSPEPKPYQGRVHLVSYEPLSINVSIKGNVAAGKTVPVIAPFDGGIQERRVQIGDRVEAGDILVTMETLEIETRLRDAQAAALRTKMALELLSGWSGAPEVLRAKRAVDAAAAGLAKSERQVAESKSLLERGIISRNEYDGLVEQRDAQQWANASARDDLQSALKRGDANNRRLAELEHANAMLKLDELQQQYDRAKVRAAVSGIVMRPPAILGPLASTTAPVEPGARVARGQCLFVIADADALVVVGRADEADVNTLRVGMEIEIESDAFPGTPIPGHLISVSAEADPGQSGKPPFFEVRAALNAVDASRRAAIRIGMSARMTIVLRANPMSIQIPMLAVRNASTAPIVRVLGLKDGETSERSIVLGATTVRGVEVLSGLEAGERLALRW
jgi:HlyD family secretion protein